MEVLSPFCTNIKSFNLFRPNETLTDSSPADLLKCGSCLTEFLLSDIVYFIQHKTKACKINHKTNGNKENLLKCSNCTESFKTADSLLQHAQFHHNINIFIENNNNNKNDQKPDTTQPNINSNHNTLSTNQQKDLNKDQIFIDVIPSDSNSIFLDHSKSYNITFSSSNVDTKNQTETQNQQIDTKSDHIDHNESSSSSCDSTPNQTQKSEQSEPTTPRPKEDNRTKKQKSQANFFCDVCNAAFNQKIHLTKHSAKHTGIKPFKCSECSYSTVERSHLKVHVRVHTGEKPFKCTFCEYATAQSSTLKIHKKRHHDKLEISQSNNQPVNLVVQNEIPESPKPLVEVKKSQLDFKNLPPTKRFKNISELENMNKTDEQTKAENNKLLGLANIALEREVDTKPPAQ